MNVFVLVLLFFIPCLSAVGMTDEEAECARELLLKDAQKAIDSMNAEELKAALDKYKAAQEQEILQEKDQERIEKLAALLVLIEKKGRVKIEDCTELKIKEDTPEAQALLKEIRAYCQNSPQSVWAEITKTGQVKLLFSTGANNGTKSVTVGGGGNMTLEYRSHEIKLGGNISSANISSGGTKSASLKYDHLLDYSLDVGIKNLETFLKWQGSYESINAAGSPEQEETYIRRQVIDLGLRYGLFNTDQMKLSVGTGVGVSMLDQQTQGVPVDPVTSPSSVFTLDFSYRPVASAEVFVNTRLQQDFLTENPRTVAGMKAGAKLSFGPLGTGVEYGADYDEVRAGDKVNHQFTANIFASVNPEDWKSEKKRKEAAEARERERVLWEKTLERIRELKARQ